MRKRLITPTSKDAPSLNEGWMDLERNAAVEVTSEEKEYPVESALVAGEMRGWRAAASGSQTIRIIFDEPQELKRISLVFEEATQRAPQSSSCDGLQMAGARFEKPYASSGISVRLIQYARLRNMRSISPLSRFSNW